jgi:hypothetical protein
MSNRTLTPSTKRATEMEAPADAVGGNCTFRAANPGRAFRLSYILQPRDDEPPANGCIQTKLGMD